MELRPYQINIAQEACDLLHKYKIAYLAMMVRTGKTITALQAAKNYGVYSVLFITKKKAIESIENDYNELKPGYTLYITNYEQVQNINLDIKFDLVIVDEASCLGQFPTRAQRFEHVKNIARGLPIIFLSGTPTPEALPQIYHQLQVSTYSPYAEYKSFYAWAAKYVFVETLHFNGYPKNDYSMNSGQTVKELEKIKRKLLVTGDVTDFQKRIDAVHKEIADKKQLILDSFKHLVITFTQEEAGFNQVIQEEIIKVEMQQTTYALARKLINQRHHIGKDGQEVIADTAVKLMAKLQQIYSGTVLTEAGTPIIFDDYKVDFIKRHFAGRKIAIYYKYIAELTMLQNAYGERITFSPEEFNSNYDKVFVSQMQSGHMGINLSTADCLVMLNIDFSSTIYQQVRDRIQSKERQIAAMVYWIFAERGIEEKIYERVKNKQTYTKTYFLKDYKIKNERTI